MSKLRLAGPVLISCLLGAGCRGAAQEGRRPGPSDETGGSGGTGGTSGEAGRGGGGGGGHAGGPAHDSSAEPGPRLDGPAGMVPADGAPASDRALDHAVAEPDGGSPAGESFVIVASGDIAAPGGAQQRTAQMLAQVMAEKPLKAILMLGDGAYRFATMTEYKALYEPTWGQPVFKALTRPIPGNHEYLQQKDAHGYFDYFNGVGQDDGPAGPRGKGYYSFDIGPWHFVALNSNDDCKLVACGEGSPQLAWLKADLAAHPNRCTLAMVHAPRYQNGTHRGDTPALQAVWTAFYEGGVDVALAAHEHNYQQFAPMDARGVVDRVKGIRSFVAGIGGAEDYRAVFSSAHMAAEEKRIINKAGFLELTMSPTGYSWRFLLTDGTVGATGNDVCR
jgi:hypothetical protein